MPHSTPVRALCLIPVLFAAGAVVPSAVAAGTAPDPVPVLSGARVRAPGPPALGFEGLNADPSSIGDFRGVVALTYLRGRARDTAGHRFIMANDIRVLQGDYVATDGMQRRGTFAFV